MKSKKIKRRTMFSKSEDVNPMNYISNLADAMLVVAVGLMLALVVAWDIDIVNTVPDSSYVEAGDVEELNENTETLNPTNQDIDGAVSIEDYGLTEYGTVYVDENGQLYVIEE